MVAESGLEWVGVVAIARNEGDRLRQCLRSVVEQVPWVVYVDSGSTDGSVDWARSLGVEVVELDLSVPFTAARARNTGWTRLQELAPEVQFVQFVDGDCELAPGWLETACEALREHSDWGAVCGRRRERFPSGSPYNRLCDLEWDTPVGEAKACGGDAMMRMAALMTAGGFDASWIAGEEPELCLRLRRQGWKIMRLDAEMTRHDAAMTKFGQWWKRSQRAGHAYAQSAWTYGRDPERYRVKEVKSIWLWGAIVPLLVLAGLWPSHGGSALLLAGYPALAYKIYRSTQRKWAARDARLYALFCVLGKFPNLAGAFQFHLNRWRGKRSQLIEYKQAELEG